MFTLVLRREICDNLRMREAKVETRIRRKYRLLARELDERQRAVTGTDPRVLAALTALIEPATRGGPESPLRWTCKSTAKLTDALDRQDQHKVKPGDTCLPLTRALRKRLM